MDCQSKSKLVLGERAWTIDDIVRISQGASEVSLSSDADWRNRIQAGAVFLEQLWQDEKTVYGVTTGVGDSCPVSIPSDLVEEFPLQLLRFHGCGMGHCLSSEAATAVMAVRLASFAGGYSGVRMSLLERICSLINQGVAPVIPEEGSVGASGDLTPLSYLAAVLVGERDVFYKGRRVAAASVLQELEMEPLVLRPKEGLAVMNGTAVMTALACLAYSRADYLMRIATLVTSLSAEALGSNREHFKAELFAAKPFPGLLKIASWIRSDLEAEGNCTRSYNSRLQDRYSIRCAPHVVGVLADALTWIKDTIEIEINSANDNPLVDGEKEIVMHGGHFYGGHIAFAMDSMKIAVANIADLIDRQLVLMTDCATNNGLPANLSGARPERAAVNHGFKAVSIAASSWAAEALKLTMPASVFSRSTECHNQDKVSMGTIAARDCLRILELSEQVAAAGLLAAVQGVALRMRAGELSEAEMTPQLYRAFVALGEEFEYLEEDRPLEGTLRRVVQLFQEKAWVQYPEN